MADHQRVHPLHDSDAAAPSSMSTAPLVARGSFRSDGGDPERQYPPPLSRTVPYPPSKPPRRRRSCFCKCLCWTISLLLLLLIILGILAAVIYFVFQPKLPEYSADSLQITQFNLSSSNTLSASFNINITARNRNKKIGIYYVGGSHLSVWYTGTKLCEGSLPVFYQGHRNTTVMSLILAGTTDNATGLLQSLQTAQQSGSVPLNLRAKVPVRLKLGRLKLMRLKFLVKCRGDVHTFGQGEVIRIRDSSCKFRFRV